MDGEPAAAGGGAAAPSLTPGLPPEPAVKDPALEAMERELATQKEQIGRLTSAVQNQPVNIQQPPQNGQPLTKEQLEKDFFKNPLDMTAAIAYKAVSDALANSEAQNFDTLVDVARNAARESDKEFFDKYRIEIEAKVMGMQLQFRKNSQIWRNAITMTKGEHVNDLLKERAGSPAPAIHDGPAKVGARSPAAPAQVALTADEKEVARGLKLSEERYRRGKSRTITNGPNSHSLDPAAWADVITFDSDAKETANARSRAAAAKKN